MVAAGNANQAVETKIRDVWIEISIEEDVGRLDVAMDIFPWAAFVEMGKPTSSTLGDS